MPLSKAIRGALPFAVALLSYGFLACALTWPVAVVPGSVVFGDYGDTRGWIAWLWANKTGYLDGQNNPLNAAPFGRPNSHALTQPITEGVASALAAAFDEITAANLFVVIGLATTALSTFALFRALGLRGGAWIGGLMFGFCPAAVMQALGGHTAYAFNAFIPLFLLALFNHRARATFASMSVVAAAFACVMFTAIYMAYFAMYLGVFFAVLHVLSLPPARRLQAVGGYVGIGVIALFIVLPVEMPAIRAQMNAPPGAVALVGRSAEMQQLETYSSRPWDYLVPSVYHPIFGPIVEPFIRNHLHDSNAFEQTLYLGYTTLLVVLYGAGLWWTRQLAPTTREQFSFFVLSAGWMYFISLPPLVGNIPTVSYLAHFVAPMFRVYARSGILVSFLLACAAAVVISHLAVKMTVLRFRLLVTAAAALLIFEYWLLPPLRPLPRLETPAVYDWLAKQPKDSIVAEYPMYAYDEAAHYNYAFWQRLHGKRLVNGASPDNRAAWAMWKVIRDLSDPATVPLLRSAGATYVIVHSEMYREGPIPGPIKRFYSPRQASETITAPAVPKQLELIVRFGGDRVYSLKPTAAESCARRPC